ncbi:hypothetical protein Pmani_019364 [Petrolisthes manimaculis]|uniref:Major facilitator superfamily (MFS) profile domain-containing protein n=1 Tax=Petrolisthes manimaculis TaxID=1843537 RepID=A0AAE1U413_9EUCA|nr:hypothetical protein Pmani_019364 [Petrolisthes manimaculis]
MQKVPSLGSECPQKVCWRNLINSSSKEPEQANTGDGVLSNGDGDGDDRQQQQDSSSHPQAKSDERTTEDGKHKVVSTRITDDEQHNNNNKPDGGWGWLVALAGFVVLFMTYIPIVNHGVIFSIFYRELEVSATMITWIFNLTLLNCGVCSLFASPLVQEYGWRRVTFVSGFVLGSGMILTAFSTSAWFLFFSFSIVIGCIHDILLSMAYGIIPHYFSRWKIVANAIMTSGASVSQMVMPLVITYLQEEFGFRGATLITGAILLHCCPAAMIFHPPEWHMKNTPHTSTITQKELPTVNMKTSSIIISLRRVLKTTMNNLLLMKSPRVIILVVVNGVGAVIFFNVCTLVPLIMNEQGFSWQDSSLCLSVTGGCNLACKILTLMLSCRSNTRVRPFYLVGLTLYAIGLVGFCVVGSLVGKVIMMMVCGFGAGFQISLFNLYIQEECGVAVLLPILGYIYVFTGFFSVILGPITGMLSDVSGNYLTSMIFWGVCQVSVTILALIPPASLPFHQQTADQQQQGCYNHPPLQQSGSEEQPIVHSPQHDTKNKNYSTLQSSGVGDE